MTDVQKIAAEVKKAVDFAAAETDKFVKIAVEAVAKATQSKLKPKTLTAIQNLLSCDESDNNPSASQVARIKAVAEACHEEYGLDSGYTPTKKE